MTDLKATPCDCAEHTRLSAACADLLRERDELREELQDARRCICDLQSKWEAEHADAKRYRFLRDNQVGEGWLLQVWPRIGGDIDEHIDAAMQEVQE